MLPLWMIVSSMLGTFGAVVLAGVLLLFSDEWRQRLLPHLLSYAISIQPGAAFLELLPHPSQRASAGAVLAVVLAGILLFLILERLVLWRQCHEEHCDVHGCPGR